MSRQLVPGDAAGVDQGSVRCGLVRLADVFTHSTFGMLRS